jgi:5-methylthioribose kinase
MAKKKSIRIAELLPEGLEESTINEIASLFHDLLEERIQAELKGLNAKVSAYLRSNMERIKEAALVELEQENETYRNAKLFESVKAMLVTELGPDDELTAVNMVGMEATRLEQDLSTLTAELEGVLQENHKFKKVIKLLNDKVVLLEEQNTSLNESVETKKPFKSSEKAVIITESEEDLGEKPETRIENEFLNEDTLSLMQTLQEE